MFEIMSGTIPVLIHIPHDSIAIPNELVDGCEFALNSSDFKVAVKKMADSGAYAIGSRYRTDCSIGTPYLIKSNVSRMIVDMERFDDEREEMNKIGHGVIYTTSADGITDIYTNEIPEHIIDRRKKLYRIYSDAVTFLVEQLRKEYGHCLIIDLHSYDQEPAEYETRPHCPSSSAASPARHPYPSTRRRFPIVKSPRRGTAATIPSSASRRMRSIPSSLTGPRLRPSTRRTTTVTP